MNAERFDFPRPTVIFLIIIAFALSLISAIPSFWNEKIEDAAIDLQFKIRGERNFSDQFVFVYISAEDIRALGGWPISRDYYGYMTHALRTLGAKVIAFDILFEKPANPYREYDEILADLFAISGNVCLPMTFTEFSPDAEGETKNRDNFPTGKKPVFPLQPLRDHAAGIGFSNLGGGGTVRKIPPAAVSEGGFTFSLGVEIVRLYWGSGETPVVNSGELRLKDAAGNVVSVPLDNRGRIRLNYPGDLKRINHIGFVNLLQTFDENPDSLNLAGKIVLIAATSPGLPVLRSIPFSDVYPASLIHATAAENIIFRNCLREVPVFVHWLIIFMIIFLALAVRKIFDRKWRILTGAAVWVGYFIAAMLFFSLFSLILPLFYPTLAYIATHGYLVIAKQKKERTEQHSLKHLLEQQIQKKETELNETKSASEAIQRELSSRQADSEQYRELAQERQQAILQLESDLRDLQGYIHPEKPFSLGEFPEIIHAPESKMTEVLALVSRVRSADIPVLIEGETGTGKEIIACAIHQSGPRKNKPFVAVNCGALPETLLESELFGHEKGSFTGALSQRRGRFEIADGGTIFLDEISETSPAFQARLLRVLQEGAFERVGGEKTLSVDVRIIAACNRDLQSEMDKGNFRADLFYRLNGFPLKLPPLRERTEDIPLLAVHFLKKHAHQTVTQISDQAMTALKNYRWPGNVRELENAIRRAAIMAQSVKREIIQSADLPPEILQGSSPAAEDIYKPLETQIIESLRVLQFSHSAITQTAKTLGDRDRGTITEYFRGICFEEFVKADHDLEKAAKAVAASTEKEVVEQVRKKIEGYLSNLYPLPEIDANLETSTIEDIDTAAYSQFKGLPKKYHSYLLQIIAFLQSKQ
jgi:transcriptional regulator with GAF, ATPase, and Fis domain